VSTPKLPKFGSVLAKQMAIAWFRDDAWESFSIQELQPLPLHPASHVLQFGSCLFEGFKTYRHPDDSLYIFRLSRHVERMRNSAKMLSLPVPDADFLIDMVFAAVNANREEVPRAPKALYVRPVLIGTSPMIAASAFPSSDACLYILTSPVGDLFAGGARPLKIAVDGVHPRATPQIAAAKAGANYAAGLGPILAGKRDHGVDQVLFAPGGEVHESGGSGFVLLRDDAIRVKEFDGSFLPSVTRDSIVIMAPDLGYQVVEHRFTIDEMLEWTQEGEAALCGTAAVLSGIGLLVHEGKEYRVGTGEIGSNTLRLRKALTDIQNGLAPDEYRWLTKVPLPHSK
jgi:branched-chain amino acid aminotransferase